MERTGGVVATVVLLATGGLLCLGMAALMGLSMALVRQSGAPSAAELPMWLMIFPLAIFGGLAAWALATAVGVWKLRPWGRISLLVFSGLLVFMQGFGLVMILFTPKPEIDARGASLDVMNLVWGGLLLFYTVQIAIGIWWLVYFNRPKIKALFAGNTPVSDRPARPLSITVIAWHYLVGGIMCLVMVPFAWPALFFGVIWKGMAAKAVYLAMGSATTFLGIALLKLYPKAVDWSVWYLVVMVANALPFWFLGDQEQLARQIMESMPIAGVPTDRPIPTAPMWLSIVFGVAMFAVPLWYLITRKKAYLAAVQAAATPNTEHGL